jgi:hypothetical protein
MLFLRHSLPRHLFSFCAKTFMHLGMEEGAM